ITLPIYIYTQIKFGITPEVNALASMLLAASLLALALALALPRMVRASRRAVRFGGRSRTATAPVSWGIWEQTIERPDLVPPQPLLETVTAMGYDALETGPPGYLAPDGAAAVRLIEPFDVELVATFLPLRLDDEDDFDDDLRALDRTTEVLA